jgi:phosphogluconate dehydratase
MISALSQATPLLTHIYPNGSADVNQFQAAGGPGWVIRELLASGCMHPDVPTVSAGGLHSYTQVPQINRPEDVDQPVIWKDLPSASPDETVVRTAQQPFSQTGGLKLLTGNLGRAVIKISSVPESNHTIEAPARVFHSQDAFMSAFKAGELECDVVVVVRFQGPRANGMPELHKLTPPLAVLQGKGFKVALLTDGRMSGASGKVPAAIHVSPEALALGPLAKIVDGDTICLDATTGSLNALVDATTWAAREHIKIDPQQLRSNQYGLGRELFQSMRQHVSSAEEGATTWLP